MLVFTTLSHSTSASVIVNLTCAIVRIVEPSIGYTCIYKNYHIYLVPCIYKYIIKSYVVGYTCTYIIVVVVKD